MPDWLDLDRIDRQLLMPAIIVLAGVIGWLKGKRTGESASGRRALRESLLVAGGYYLYKRGRIAVVGDAEDALRNSQRVLDFEQWLHLDFEPSLQRPVLEHETLLRIINGYYSWAFIPFVLGALLWTYHKDDTTFRMARTALGVSILFALATFAFFPVAPPRMLPEANLIATHDLLGKPEGFTNPYAAVPSFHVGWTALCGYALFRAVRSRVRWFWLVGPVTLMALTVMVTGNHYWIDGAVGAAFVFAPVAVMKLVPRLASTRDQPRLLSRFAVRQRTVRI